MDTDARRLELISTVMQLPADQLAAATEALRHLPRTNTTGSTTAFAPRDWPHAPRHSLLPDAGTYMVTTGTYEKQHYFGSSDRLDLLECSLPTIARKYDWHLEAWAVFSNHYHFVGYSAEPKSLKAFLTEFHANTARELNRLDG